MKAVKRIFLVGVLVLLSSVMFFSGRDIEAKKTSLKKAKITLSKKSYTYNGKARKPSVTVKIGKKKVNKKYYSIKYKSNKKPGTAKVTIKAKKKKGKAAKYKGTKTKTFKIKKASRTLIPDKLAYTAVEGDGAFQIGAKASKGSGTISYSCSTSDVIKITKTGKVTIVKKFNKNCKNLSKETKETIKKAKATVKISIPENSYYKAASTTVSVTISKKSARTVNTANSIKNYKYPTLNYACDTKKLTDFDWSVVNKFQVPGLAPTADDDWIKEYVQCNNLCPQGMCVAGDYMLTTAYCMDDIHNSCIFIYNKNTGEYLRTLVLNNQKTHVGGITYDSKNQNVWICHSKKDKKTGLYSLQKITYTELEQYANGKKSCVLSATTSLQKIPTKPSTISYCESDGYLWIAQFSDPAKATDDEDTDEEIAKDSTNDARMYAYEYKDGKLTQVKYINNTAIEDYLGVQTVDETTGEEPVVKIDKVYRTKGVLVKETLQKGDILYKVGDVRIESTKQLEEVLTQYKEGDKVDVEILREKVVFPDEVVSGGAVTGGVVSGGAVSGGAVSGGTSAGEEASSIMQILDQLLIGERGEILYRSIPSYVQGVTFTKSGKTIFSCSYGRNATKKKFLSQLLVYGKTKKDNLSGMGEIEMAVALPPMVEEVEMVGEELYMIFESAATQYLEGTDGKGQSESPIDKIVAVKLKLE